MSEGEQAVRIINTYDQMKAAGGDQVAIAYRPNSGHAGGSAAWQVHRVVNGVPMKTDPEAPWYNYWLKTFLVFGFEGMHHERKRAAYEQALAWVTQKYGKRTFVLKRRSIFPLPRRTAEWWRR